MATATYTPSTSDSDLDTLWKKEQLGVVEAYQFGVEEFNAVMDDMIRSEEINWSAREITRELDLNDDLNVASIPEGGFQARPQSGKPVTATMTWILLNARFTMSDTAKHIQNVQGTRGQLKNQMRHQAMKKVQTVRRKIGDLFYGKSDGVICHVATYTGGTPSINVDNLYGDTRAFDATNKRQETDLFRELEFYAIVTTGGALRGIFQVIDGGIDRTLGLITMSTTVASTADGDLVVGAASLGNTTIAHTDYSRGLVGITDGMSSTTVHSVSSATESRWAAARENTAGGRFNTTKLLALKDDIVNKGGGKLDISFGTQGVERDLISQQLAGVRFSSTFNMEIDGSVRAKGIDMHWTQRVPDGYFFGWDKKKTFRKSLLLPKPSDGVDAFDGGENIPDVSGRVYSMDLPIMFNWRNRASSGYYSNLTES